METIREVWVKNLNDLIGEKSLKEVSVDSGVPYSTLRNMLQGHIAEGLNLTKLATYFKVPETYFFTDFEVYMPRKEIDPKQALEIIAKEINTPKVVEMKRPKVDIPDDKVDFVTDLLDVMKSDNGVAEFFKNQVEQRRPKKNTVKKEEKA